MSEIGTSIRRAPYQSLAAFLVLFFTLFLSLTLFVSMSFLYSLLGYIETRPQVTAYFGPKTSEEDIVRIRKDIVDSGKALSVKYITKEEAFQIYKNLNKDNPLLLEMVSADILPPSLEIYAVKPQYLPEIAEHLKREPTIEDVDFQKDIVERLLALTNFLRKITVIFFTYLFSMSVIVLTTTTLFKIALKKDQIELERLLGATKWYIRKPFLMEGILFGLCASLVSFLIVALIMIVFQPFLMSYFRGIPALNLNLGFVTIGVWPYSPLFFGLSFGLTALFGVIIAIIANLLAMKKYLKT